MVQSVLARVKVLRFTVQLSSLRFENLGRLLVCSAVFDHLKKKDNDIIKEGIKNFK